MATRFVKQCVVYNRHLVYTQLDMYLFYYTKQTKTQSYEENYRKFIYRLIDFVRRIDCYKFARAWLPIDSCVRRGVDGRYSQTGALLSVNVKMPA